MSRPLVTVRTLLAQLRARGAIELPPAALITPAARDWLRGCRVPVRNADASSRDPQGANSPSRGPEGVGVAATPDETPRFYLIADPRDPFAQALLPALERRWPRLAHVAVGPRAADVAAAIRGVATQLAGCPRHRAVALLTDGALAVCVANRFPHVRAAVLTRPGGLHALQHELGINLLILEREPLAFAQLRATSERFFAGPIAVAPDVRDALTAAGSGADLAGHVNAGCSAGSGRACPCGS